MDRQSGPERAVAYLGQFHAQDYYYPLWLEEESHTYYGTGLRQNTTQTPGGDWSNNSFEWGYVDNAGSDNLESSSKTGKTWFKISNAMTPDGQPAGLRYIDFIKVQSAINGSAEDWANSRPKSPEWPSTRTSTDNPIPDRNA